MVNCILRFVRKINILRIVFGGFGCAGVFLPVCVQNRSFLRIGRAFVLADCCFGAFCFVLLPFGAFVGFGLCGAGCPVGVLWLLLWGQVTNPF